VIGIRERREDEREKEERLGKTDRPSTHCLWQSIELATDAIKPQKVIHESKAKRKRRYAALCTDLAMNVYGFGRIPDSMTSA
jgi:hypothetical protein